MSKPLNVYLVLGEESGDKLAADLIPALQAQAQRAGLEVNLSGLAGHQMTQKGMTSLFDIKDIAVMGFSAVLARLPMIIRRVYQTVSDIVDAKPDVIILIDSPDFTHAVAKRVRRRMPNVPIINYICPSVWAWRSGRAKKMTAYVDHVLAILPFEPKVLKDLGGPDATYIGHPLALQISSSNSPSKSRKTAKTSDKLLVLPGSRQGEVKRMLKIYGKTLTILQQRGVQIHPVIPAVPHLKTQLQSLTSDWPVQPEIVDSADNMDTFASARAALATSGTVALELALHKVPMIIAYRLDPIGKMLSGLISTWSAVLPNHILDRVLVPEEHNEMVIPERLARYLERLLDDSPERKSQLTGFDELATAMKTKQPPAELAAEIILRHVK
ncbi:MAG: lipid-A-disaccharide synthase [Rhizobiaceae bacterium]|nr:lipid-A-disaccharide synthase [Rhizobiaceae bacterium]